MIVVVPAETPETTPLAVPTDAMPVLLLIQVPPPLFVRVVTDPGQTVAVPPIVPGKALTLKTVVV